PDRELQRGVRPLPDPAPELLHPCPRPEAHADRQGRRVPLRARDGGTARPRREGPGARLPRGVVGLHRDARGRHRARGREDGPPGGAVHLVLRDDERALADELPQPAHDPPRGRRPLDAPAGDRDGRRADGGVLRGDHADHLHGMERVRPPEHLSDQNLKLSPLASRMEFRPLEFRVTRPTFTLTLAPEFETLMWDFFPTFTLRWILSPMSLPSLVHLDHSVKWAARCRHACRAAHCAG